jgi:hypothetical protein
VELPPRFEEWLEDIRWQNPHSFNEEILFAALACGLDSLRRDERLATKLKKWYPPETTAERFPHVALRILSGRVSTHIPKRASRVYREVYFGDGCGPRWRKTARIWWATLCSDERRSATGGQFSEP